MQLEHLDEDVQVKHSKFVVIQEEPDFRHSPGKHCSQVEGGSQI